MPQSSPARGGGPAQLVEGYGRVVPTPQCRDHRAYPSTIQRMVPLPVPGRIVALTILLAACASPTRTPTPTTIVSLNPCTDAILAEVADPAQIAALSSYSSDPAASSMDVAVAQRFRSVSGAVEEVAALRPALVIGSTFTPPATRSALDRKSTRLNSSHLPTSRMPSSA